VDYKIGDLVLCKGLPGIVIKVVNSKVFEGGPENLLVTVLFNEKKQEIMSWQLKKANI
jgi:hypothetical protein